MIAIDFDAPSHTYRIGGVKYPSVTTILDEIYREFEHVPPEILEPARQFGTDVHMAVFLENHRRLEREGTDAVLLAYVDQWLRLVESLELTVIAAEHRVCHLPLGYAGTLDVLAIFERVLCLFDIKSGTVPRTVGQQTAAYVAAYQTNPISKAYGLVRRRYCVQLDGHATKFPNVIRLDKRTDLNLFISALNCYRFKQDWRQAS